MWWFPLHLKRQTPGGLSLSLKQFFLYLLITACMQVCWYFPLKGQLQYLLQIGNYHKLLMYEREHRSLRKQDEYMCDIYDSPRWQWVAGPLCVQRRLARIVLHACVDGVPAAAHGRQESGSTVKPLQYYVANLPPWLRYKMKWMIVHALIPAHLKGKSAKKYYDWLGHHEITPLYNEMEC